jgi:opacity protein-like surface antigen
MKPLLVALLILVFAAPCALAGFGFGVKAGVSQNSDEVLEFVKDFSNDYDNTEGFAVLSFEALYEQAGPFGLPESSALGIKAAFDLHQQDEMDEKTLPMNIKIKSYKIPLTVYYKYKPSSLGLHPWGGAGVTMAYTKWQSPGYSDETDRKTGLHVTGGVEYRFTNLIALGLDLTYTFNVKTSNGFYRDLGGLSGGAAARLYF